MYVAGGRTCKDLGLYSRSNEKPFKFWSRAMMLKATSENITELPCEEWTRIPSARGDFFHRKENTLALKALRGQEAQILTISG